MYTFNQFIVICIKNFAIRKYSARHTQSHKHRRNAYTYMHKSKPFIWSKLFCGSVSLPLLVVRWWCSAKWFIFFYQKKKERQVGVVPSLSQNAFPLYPIILFSFLYYNNLFHIKHSVLALLSLVFFLSIQLLNFFIVVVVDDTTISRLEFIVCFDFFFFYFCPIFTFMRTLFKK